MTKTEKFVERIAKPVNAIKGYDLPVSAFDGYEDGTFENGTSAFEREESQFTFQYGKLKPYPM